MQCEQLCYFIGFMGMTEGRPPSQVIEKFRDIYGTALITNWKVWPLAQVRTDPY
jgi:protein Mpv17